MTARAVVYINGKFTAQPTTGVQRVATRLVQALDQRAQGLPGRWILLHPPVGCPPALRHIECLPVGSRRDPLHAWEQLRLPWAARRGLLLNLAGSAPWLARRQVCLIHDAAVFDHPEAYTRGFVAWYRHLFRSVARRGATLLTVSHFSRQRLAAALKVDASRITVVPNGADHLDTVQPDEGLLLRLGLAGQRYWLAVGSANPTKNLDLLVRAYAGRPAGALPCRLVIVGGRNERVFASGAGAIDPPGLVRTGPLGDAQLKALYLHAGALVFPSLYEGFGIPPLEAMACGCPVIASRAASIPEVCGEAALYVDPLSVVDLQSAMELVLHDEASRTDLRQRGLAQAGRYRWAVSAEYLLAALPSESRA